jgi:hypothetical protein
MFMTTNGIRKASINSQEMQNNAKTNPRQQVLENFKEISRIMTQSFLSHKQIENRFGKN